MNRAQIARMTDPLARRIRALVTRALVTLVDDSTALQVLQLRGVDGEVLAGVARIQNFGRSSCPPAGAEGVFVLVGGARTHAVAIAVDDPRYRPRDLEPGEQVLYTPQGSEIRMKASGEIAITTTGPVTVNAADVDVNATQSVTIDGGASVMIQGHDFLTHRHSGVQAGGGNTGPVF